MSETSTVNALALPLMSRRLDGMPASVIRGMAGLNDQLHGAEAVDLARGLPEFAPPPAILDAAQRAIGDGWNQYAPPMGTEALRQAVADCLSAEWGRQVDPGTEVTVCCGTTEGMIAALLATVDPGDEVVVFEPAYENYAADCNLAGAIPRYVRLHPPAWTLDLEELSAVFTKHTRAIIINSPHNPTGRVFSPSELEAIADLCVQRNVVAITDEVYEPFTFSAPHVSIATVPGMEDRTVTIRGASKAYAVTGWRVGWTVATPELTAAIRQVHELLTVGAPHPLQIAVAEAIGTTPPSYHAEVRETLRARRDLLVDGLIGLGFELCAPEGGLFAMAGTSLFGYPSDVAMARDLIERGAVGSVPGSGFYLRTPAPAGHLRFTFAKKEETIARGLAALRSTLGLRPDPSRRVSAMGLIE